MRCVPHDGDHTTVREGSDALAEQLNRILARESGRTAVSNSSGSPVIALCVGLLALSVGLFLKWTPSLRWQSTGAVCCGAWSFAHLSGGVVHASPRPV